MRRSLLTLVALAVVAVGTLVHAAERWPNRSVTLIVPFAPGSTVDAAARIIADRLSDRLGAPFVVENKIGSSGNLGTNGVARATPDGYTIGVSIVGPLALNTLLFPSLPYNPVTDLALVSVLVSQPSILVVNPALGIKTTEALMARLKTDNGKFNYGSIGTGSLSHLAMEAIALKSGTRPAHVPYAGSPAVLTDLMRGDIHMAVMPAGAVVPLAEAGKVTLLAVSSAHRSSLLPNLPTLAEAGISGVEANAWIGLIAPVKTDPQILADLAAEIREILAEPAVRATLRNQFMEPIGSTAAEFRALVDGELERWGPIIKDNNIRIGQ